MYKPNASPIAATEPNQLISRLIESSGGVNSLARSMRQKGIVTQMDSTQLESWTRYPEDFRSIDPITKTARLITCTKSLLPLQWLCGRLGCCFVPGRAAFTHIRGKGSRTWFAASLQLHDLRRVVISAFLQDNPSSKPEITGDEGRLIAKSWSTVFGWVEGFLRSHSLGADLQPRKSHLSRAHSPILFRTTSSWRIMTEALADPKCPSRNAVSEAVGHPFGGAKQGSDGFPRYPLKDTVDKWAQSRGEDGNTGNGSRGPLDYTLALCHAANSLEPLAWLAAESGGYLVFPRLPTIPKLSFVDLLQFWERTMVELAELDSSIARALLDRQIEPTELAQLQNEWEDVVEWMTGFVAEW